ncbi:hypothetical protein FNV43_RR00423 [Rhamnella rubrinervis]|uniref:Uncharacterized protein n=1 Tax=Rhamnella rubrinervis TaxID=2594499 RepID=A0A8K0MR56_9ROSA|nr:hypothetical protein FNV43_RR00423 [Rhamnella rubrinervis]
MTLLKSTFLKYEHAMIATVLTTLNATIIVLTFYLNFNVFLKDSNLSTMLRIQIQMTGPLLITGERDDIPSIIHIPKQIALEKLRELIPLEWFTRYERIHKATTPLLSMDPSFQPIPDGTFRTSFSKPSSEASPST